MNLASNANNKEAAPPKPQHDHHQKHHTLANLIGKRLLDEKLENAPLFGRVILNCGESKNEANFGDKSKFLTKNIDDTHLAQMPRFVELWSSRRVAEACGEIIDCWKDLGLSLEQDCRIGIYSNNDFWLRLLLTALAMSKAVQVPIFSILKPKAILQTLTRAKCNVIIVDTVDRLIKLTNEDQLGFLNTLQRIILIEKVQQDEIETKLRINQHIGTKVTFLGDLLTMSRDYKTSGDEAAEAAICPKKTKSLSPEILDQIAPEADDLLALVPTSGSSGQSKIVKITHRNIYMTLQASLRHFDKIIKEHFASNSPQPLLTYSLLPEQHILGQYNAHVVMISGGCSVYPSLPHRIRAVFMQDITAVAPNVMTFVPLILTRLMKSIKAMLDGVWGARCVFEHILSHQHNSPLYRYAFALIFYKIRKIFGGNLKVVLCGAARLSEETRRFFELCFHPVILIQGYGLTECIVSSQKGAAIAPLKATDCGEVLDEIKIAFDYEFESSNNKNKDGGKEEIREGEILIGGHCVTPGYLDDEELNRKSFINGYFRTGDVGYLDEFNHLHITDRCKDIFKLSNGEYITPTRIENFYEEQIGHLANVFVYGESWQSFVVAIAFVSAEELSLWFPKHQNTTIGDDSRITGVDCDLGLITDNEMIEKMTNDLNNIWDSKDEDKSCTISRTERPKKWIFSTNVPSVENNMLTPTMKLKRKEILRLYREKLTELLGKV
ncbi:MAG: hypothetical protein MHMPM18_001413 [Marteilia pararefringens]